MSVEFCKRSHCHRRRSRGIFRPRVLRVASPQLLPHLGVRPLPEAPQVARGLHRPSVGSEQLQRQRLLSRADTWSLGQAEELLQLHRRHHRSILLILQPGRAAAGKVDALRRGEVPIHEPGLQDLVERNRVVLREELSILEDAWREAEEIAGISDNLFLPEEISTQLDELKRQRG